MTIRKCIVLTILLMSSTVAVYSQSSEQDKPATHMIDAVEAREHIKAQFLMKRLDQIRTMDKSKLSVEEKQELRNEVKSIKKNMKEIGGGVYLSVGAIIIIVLLLILLL